MNYYWFNRKELLEKTNKMYHKEGSKEKEQVTIIKGIKKI